MPASDTKAREEHRRRGDTRRTGDAHEAGRATYRTLATGDTRSLLSVELTSGRNNRLRRQLAALHCPIVGDWRNGSTEKELGRVALEGTHLSFVHPVTGKLLEFRQPIPPLFRKLVKGAQVATKNPKKSVRK